MPTTPRELARAQTMGDIVRIGRDQLRTGGPAALSLRAVARELGVVSSAVYRYVSSKDQLLTLLIVDAYDELADRVDAALADTADDPWLKFCAIGRAVREWALAEPARYALIHGSPVPGYQAPGDQTTGPGTRVLTALVGIFETAYLRGELGISDIVVPPQLQEDFERIRDEFDLSIDDSRLAAAICAWTGLYGAVSFEVFGQYGPDTFRDPAAFFDAHLTALGSLAGLRWR